MLDPTIPVSSQRRTLSPQPKAEGVGAENVIRLS